MDRLGLRLADAERALATLAEALAIEAPTPLERDGAIQRFEYTFEVVWKLGQRYLAVHEGQPAVSPKAVFRGLGSAGVLSILGMQHAMEMTDDRNLTVHTYVEGVADKVHGELARHHGLLAEIAAEIRRRTVCGG
ncbi:MAG: nucleotidyltransferase substrate binding protein [Armatimonadetes bacterium]|nr:nucleotidyltransferase substrate binding protein [Armatimonadota bacterium]